jgi:DNA helicase IV
VAHPDLQREQAYVDHAYACLERMRGMVARAAEAGATDVASEAIERWTQTRLRTFADAERGLCFGRLDLEAMREPLYVGRRWVHDDAQRMLVVNWQAPAARPFYTATPAAPHGVALRRRFRTRGRTLLDISDEALDGSVADGIGTVDDFLLEELEAARGQRMRDIVATIQADQYRLIAREPEPPLVIQGGPGTGKTAVGLHRASFLLYTHRTALRRVLVVGPNPIFMDYVAHVLPTLGEDAVDQRAVSHLLEGVEPSREDPFPVQELKADPRLARVVRRAVELRLERPARELVARLDGAYVGAGEQEVAELRARVREERGLSAAARERFRMEVLRAVYREYGRKLGHGATLGFDELEAALRREGRLRAFLDAVWPAVRGGEVVRGLLASPARLEQAADGILDAAEQRLLRRRGRGWSAADVPLVDEAVALAEAPPRAYGHVIVDEAQDLSPMQLRMVGRRVGGAFTILGDVAQATGPVAYGGWDELLAHLPGGGAAEVEELRHAYRVPREIMAFALPLLEVVAPGTAPPLAYRAGAAPPRLVPADDPAAAALEEAERLAAEEGLVAVIAPDGLRPAAGERTGTVFDELRLPLLAPREAKGLEFDHVVVVEPARIVADAGGARGLRELYVALTRPTKTLVVVHAEPLPEPLQP